MKKIIRKLSMALPALALLVGIGSINSACYLFYHQPVVPMEMDEFRK